MANEQALTETPLKPGADAEQPKPTAEEALNLETAMAAFGDTFSGRKKKESVRVEPIIDNAEEVKPPVEQEEEKVKHKSKKADDDKVEETHKPKSKSKAKSVESSLSETRLAEIAADAGARASAETISRIEKEKAKPADRQADEFKPPKEYTKQYAAFKVMAKTDDRYSNLPEEFKAFVKEEEDYIKQWKRDHPSEKWHGEADEHNDFYQRATPNYDEADLRRAEIKMEVSESKEATRREVLEELKPKLDELEQMKRERLLRDLQPAVATAEKTAMGSILKAIDPAYEKFTDPVELAKLKDEDPLAFDVAIQVASDALPFAAEATRLWKGKGAVKADDNNPLHRYIFEYGTKMGELIKALPDDDQVRDGKKFATWNEFNALKPEQQARHWTITDQDLIERKLLDAQEIARERFASEDKKLASWAKRKGMSSGNANNSLPKAATERTEQPAKPLPGKENNGSPSVGSRTQVSPSTEAPQGTQPAWLDQFGAIMSGRKV